MKIHYIGKIETGLHKREIEERVREVSIEDKLWNIDVKGKALRCAKFEEDTFSCFYLSGRGKQDMLSPRIHVTIQEEKGGCILDISYSRTWSFLYLFIFWSCVCWMGACVNFAQGYILVAICYIAIYALGIGTARKHRINMCNKVVSIIKETINS